MKRKDELRNIYHSQNQDFEEDFTPKIAKEILEQRHQELLRSRILSILFGVLTLIFSVALISIVIHDVLKQNQSIQPTHAAEKNYIPRHSLSSEAVWVIDYKQAIDHEGLVDDVPGPKPLSTKWVKKAAYHTIMGQQALAVDELDEALQHFREVVEIYPEIEGIHRVLGTLFIKKEQYATAADHLELALKEQESFETINNLGTAYIGIQQYDRAEKQLKRALELQPESPICHKNLAILYRDMKQIDTACYHFEKYLALRPDDTKTMQTYAMYLTKQGRWADAATFLETLTEQVTDVAPIYFLLAQVQVQNGRQDKAIAALKRGIQLVDPTLALAWMNQNEFNDVRESPAFRKLIDELEIATVSLDAPQ